MSKKKFYRYTREEFEQALAETKYNWNRVSYDFAGEYAYEHESEDGNYLMRIWSSIDKSTDQARDKDKDAIRLAVLWTETMEPVLTEKRTNRIGTWKKNLLKKINNIQERQKELQICSECSSVMVIRENESGNQFYGCSGYPECKNTESVN
jgi:hypothetical protein